MGIHFSFKIDKTYTSPNKNSLLLAHDWHETFKTKSQNFFFKNSKKTVMTKFCSLLRLFVNLLCIHLCICTVSTKAADSNLGLGGSVGYVTNVARNSYRCGCRTVNWAHCCQHFLEHTLHTVTVLVCSIQISH